MKTTIKLASASCALALLAGCDGATITIDIEPHSSSSSVVAESSSSVIEVSSSSSIESSSSSSVDICDSDTPPPGAPACYKISPECDDTMVCAIEYRVSDYCGVRGLNAEIVDVPLESCTDTAVWDYQKCEQLNGATFYTTTLEEGGNTPDGISKMHWRFHFDNGDVRLMQSDFGIGGTYTCRDDQVVVTLGLTPESEHVLDIDARLFQFHFAPLGGEEKLYQNTYQEEPISTEACSQVAGNHYVLQNAAASPLELDYYVTFDKSPNTVTYSDGEKVEQGYYDCDLGLLHIHTPSHDEYPLSPLVAKDGSSITIGKMELPLANPTPGICTKEYAPVCGTQTVQCVTAPCYPLHKTYGNQCEADSSQERVLFEGECGKLEGTPVTTNPVICPAVYDPVCAKVANNEIACITEPCPNHEYKTFGNACEAGGQYAMTSFNESCDLYSLEGQLSFEQPPARLDMKDDDALKDVRLLKSDISDDILTVTVGYSGCNAQPINFTVDTQFLESNPVQANYYFSKTIDQACEAYFEEQYAFDLLPLKAAYQTLYQSRSGVIALGKLGTYQF